jgi:mono/diheme cytochrome c family protein
VKEVFVGRMSGFNPSADQSDALSSWLDRQPALHAEPADALAAERGKVLFESPEARCSQCHAGAHLTNNKTENVGTGADLQVPSLQGVRFRTPLMHDGCAATLSERFTDVLCGGGDKHGTTSQLSAAQVGDLTAYLETL